MGFKLITGKTGSAHVASADDRARIAAMFGPGEYIVDSGNGCFAATIVDNNNISIGAGDLIAFGTHSRIAYGDTESIVIDSGAVGYNRIDLIVADYKNTSGVESCSFKVIKGAASSGTPSIPTAVSGNILQGASASQTVLYKVTLNGINIVTCERMIPIVSIPASSVASAFSASATYAVGALVSYGGKLYKCTTAVTVTGAWDSENWSVAILADVLSTHTHTPESIGAADALHASEHGPSGSDPVAPATIGAEPATLRFSDVDITTLGWETYTAAAGEETLIKANGYTYRKALDLPGVLANMDGYVIASANKKSCGTSIHEKQITYNGGMYLYAKAAPSVAFTLLRIIVFKAVS